jgi:hypothetical protein
MALNSHTAINELRVMAAHCRDTNATEQHMGAMLKRWADTLVQMYPCDEDPPCEDHARLMAKRLGAKS